MRSIRYFLRFFLVSMKENFFRRTYTFIVDEDKNIVLDKLATLFEEQYDYWIDRYNSHVSRESFKLEPPVSYLFRRWVYDKSFYALGEAERLEDGRTKILLHVRPNRLFLVYFLGALTAAIISWVSFLSTMNPGHLMAVLITSCIAVPLTYWLPNKDIRVFIGRFSRFVQAFPLRGRK